MTTPTDKQIVEEAVIKIRSVISFCFNPPDFELRVYQRYLMRSAIMAAIPNIVGEETWKEHREDILKELGIDRDECDLNNLLSITG